MNMSENQRTREAQKKIDSRYYSKNNREARTAQRELDALKKRARPHRQAIKRTSHGGSLERTTEQRSNFYSYPRCILCPLSGRNQWGNDASTH